jgi:hypothetical protein
MKEKETKIIYKSPLGLEVIKFGWDKNYTITGNAKREMTVKEFDSAYDFEEYIQNTCNCKSIDFDSESCQFFAYAKTKQRALSFIKAIENQFEKIREVVG